MIVFGNNHSRKLTRDRPARSRNARFAVLTANLMLSGVIRSEAEEQAKAVITKNDVYFEG